MTEPREPLREEWAYPMRGVLVRYVSYRSGVMRVELQPFDRCKRGEIRDYAVPPELCLDLIYHRHPDAFYARKIKALPSRLVRRAK